VRGNQFLANLIIQKTDLQWSIGKVDTLNNPNVQVRRDDTVLSRVN
jgi:hypothetical protein